MPGEVKHDDQSPPGMALT